MPRYQSDSPIRVTLVLPRQATPVWLRNILVALRKADFISLNVVTVLLECGRYQSRSPQFSLWMWLEATAFGHKIAVVDRSEDLTDISEEFESGHRDVNGTIDDLHRSIEPGRADIVVWMLPDRPPAELVSRTKNGVLTIADAFETTFGFREFVEQEPAIRCDVIVYGNAPNEDRVLASSFVATDAVLFARGISGARAKCQALLMSSIKRIWRHADPRLDGIPRQATKPYNRKPPSFLRTVWGLLQFCGRYLAIQLMRPFYFDQWQLAYRMGGDRMDQNGLQRLAPSHTGFWADPFIAEKDGRKFIFFEELSPVTTRGHIAAIEIFSDGRLGEPINVLTRDYHLSYPFLFEYEDSLYMVPECAESGRVEVFRCEEFPQRWESHTVLLDGVRAFDPTLIEHDGMWWMFITMQHDGNSVNDELHLFFATSPFDEWTPHPLNPVKLDVRSARPAGAIFRDNGKLLRPAQDCSGRYGRAISIQEVRCMTPEKYEEVELRRISADWAIGAHATHTINQASGVTIYDCEINRRK